MQCKVSGVGQGTAIKLMQQHGLDVDAIADPVKSGVCGASFWAVLPDNWATLIRSVMDVFVNPFVYDLRSKTQECMGGARWEEKSAPLGEQIRRASPQNSFGHDPKDPARRSSLVLAK